MGFLRLPLVTLASVLSVCLGCVTGGGGSDSASDDDREAGTVPCDNPDDAIDAGFCEAPQELDGPGPRGDACAALLLSTCGADNECSRDPGCVAADLVARFEPERCAGAAGDTRSFPPCSLGTCTVLATKVCGPEVPGNCEDAPGCSPARALEARAAGGDASADDSCAQALSDETLFPNCG